MKNKLRVLRAERSWSQAQLAERLGVSRQTVHAIEAEKYDPSLPLAFTIAHVFDRTIEEIFDDGRADRGRSESRHGDSRHGDDGHGERRLGEDAEPASR